MIIIRFMNILSINLCWFLKDYANYNIYNWDDLKSFIYRNLLKKRNTI